jgi:glycosyltransferase involved in cell wall biosynthesis
LIAASFEDYGLTPLEAAAHGKPTAALRWGGFLDTVVEHQTGIFFDAPTAAAISEAVVRLANEPFSATAIRRHAGAYAEDAFVRRLKTIVAAEAEQKLAQDRRPVLAEAG